MTCLAVYKKSEQVSVVPYLIGQPGVYTSNLDVAKQLVAGGTRSVWIKPEDASQALMYVCSNSMLLMLTSLRTQTMGHEPRGVRERDLAPSSSDYGPGVQQPDVPPRMGRDR